MNQGNNVIIAEVGVNHNGNMHLAKKMIDVAKLAGADYVKFQSFTADNLVVPTAKKAAYQIKNTDDSGQFGMLKSLELSHEDHLELIQYCNEVGIKFLSTAFDIEGIKYLKKLGLNLFKVPSGEITNYPYLKEISKSCNEVILSTGMANMDEIGLAIEVLQKGVPKKNITILHCNTEYPTPYEDVNLKAMLSIQKQFGVNIGYSDHTLGIEVPIAAVTLGATVIEKHFTLDRTMEGPDHKASLEPDELISMVSSIRNIEKALSGNGIKAPSKSEQKNINIARKSIFLKRAVQKGTELSSEDLISLRPGDGISPMMWNTIIGKRVKNSFPKHHQLALEDLE